MCQLYIFYYRCVKYDGRRVVSGAYDYSVRVWDAATGHRTACAGRPWESGLFASVRRRTKSGDKWVVGHDDIRVWDISGSSGESRQILTGHKSLNSDMQLRGNVLVSKFFIRPWCREAF